MKNYADSTLRDLKKGSHSGEEFSQNQSEMKKYLNE